MLPHRILSRSNLAKQCILLALYASGSVYAAEQLTPQAFNSANYPANVQGPNTLPTSYFYMGGELGINHYQHGCDSGSLDCDKNATMAGFFAGYQFNQYLALEAAYIDLGSAKAAYLEGGKNQAYEGTMQGVNLSAVASMPVYEDFTVFAKAGVFNWYGENKGPFATLKADDWAPSVGLGMTYQISDAWQARMQYQYFHHLGNDDIGGTNAHATSVGISYQFGRARPEIITQIVTNTVITAAPTELEPVTFPVLFDFDSSKLLFVDSLQIVVKRLTQYPDAKVVLQGFSDSQGEREYNLGLAAERTDAIKQYLLERGVKPEQMITENYGEQYPADTAISEDQKYLNRRVQVVLPSMTLQPQEQ
ncbi:OmpA family protein [Shewanella sp. SNU WT4]|uniref:OmpA family protein n=1 Tax=Shewanella sp. SNU WT4 TaxID=2590015 RepID=UPI0011267E0A|nr:OmpA family protein [Shewanella sp. SNU WT4]QDF66917.1 OmpA family protein [Shewanella sp. SNU WT4]